MLEGFEQGQDQIRLIIKRLHQVAGMEGGERAEARAQGGGVI